MVQARVGPCALFKPALDETLLLQTRNRAETQGGKPLQHCTPTATARGHRLTNQYIVEWAGEMCVVALLVAVAAVLLQALGLGWASGGGGVVCVRACWLCGVATGDKIAVGRYRMG